VASEGGSLSPAGLYVGVVDLFSILLPGAILTFLLYSTPFLFHYIVATEFTYRALPNFPAAIAIAFVVISYVTGHFLRALGYFVTLPFSKYLLSEYAHTSHSGRHYGTVTAQAEGAVRKIVGCGVSPEVRLRWSAAYLSFYSTQAAARLDNLDAQRKFFRNLAPTLYLSFPLIDSMHKPFSNRPAVELFIVIGLLMCLFLHDKQIPHKPWQSLVLFLTVWLAPLFVSIAPIWQPWSSPHFYVNVGIYILMLLAGARFVALQRDLITSADEFLVVLFRERPESVSSAKGDH